MTATYARSASQTSEYTSVVHITRKLQTDILAIGDTYQFFTEQYAQEVIHDVRIFIDEEVIEKVAFIWTERGSAKVLEELRYVVVMGQVGLADDRPGGIRYNSALAGADFRVRITYNSRWYAMNDSGKGDIRERLALWWGPGGQLDYSGGQWVNERTYSKDGSALVHSRFVR